MIGSALQKAIYAALMNAPAIAGGRVYDRPPEAVFTETPPEPYITIGDEQVLDDGNSCSNDWEVFSDIHVWSRSDAGSKVEAKDLVRSIVARLVDETLYPSGFTVLISQLENSRTFRDPDGITEHAVVTVRHVLQPA